MLHDIDRVRADALSDGLADISELEAVLGNAAAVQTISTRWQEVFPPMVIAANNCLREQTASKRDAFFLAYDAFLEGSFSSNATFLRLCLEGYKNRL
jgi:hypothetical protein